MNSDAVISYFDAIAPSYDRTWDEDERVRSLSARERQLLTAWLTTYIGGRVMDLACGSGRLLDLATHGQDASLRMVRSAAEKHPSIPILWRRADSIRADPGSFDAIFCLHLFEHISPERIGHILAECHRVLRPGGAMIFDLPCAFRRSLTRARPQGWYGSTTIGLFKMRTLLARRFELVERAGIGLLPAHITPESMRGLFIGLDGLLGRTPLKLLAVRHLCLLRKV
jgi:SAM-dependent methyltransferase